MNFNHSVTLFGMDFGRLMVAVEAYPDLKVNQNFRQLQGSLTSLVATAFAFRAREFSEISEAERAAPQVNFSEGKGTH